MKRYVLFYLLVSALSIDAQTLVVTDSLTTARTKHQAQLLPNGKVLVFGGETPVFSSLALNSCELYDPATGTWSSAQSMNSARTRFGSMLLPNGNVLAFGGDTTGNNDETTSCEIYDYVTNTWTYSESLHAARYDFSFSKLNDGRLLIAAGLPIDSETEIFDPATGHWTIADSATTERPEGSFMVTLPNNKVLLASAWDFYDGITAELYDPSTDTWSAIGNMNSPHDFGSAILLNNGKVLIAGSVFNDGFVAEIFDPATNTFTLTDSTLQIRGHTQMIKLNNGNPMIFGLGDAFNAGNTQCIEVYDVATGQWMSQIYSIVGVQDYTFTRISLNTILVAGGNFTFVTSKTCGLITDNTIGIEEVNTPYGSVYPNPTTDKLNIHLDARAVDNSKISIEVFDLSGRALMRNSIYTIDDQIDISDLPEGVYYFLMRDEVAIVGKGNFIKMAE